MRNHKIGEYYAHHKIQKKVDIEMTEVGQTNEQSQQANQKDTLSIAMNVEAKD